MSLLDGLLNRWPRNQLIDPATLICSPSIGPSAARLKRDSPPLHSIPASTNQKGERKDGKKQSQEGGRQPIKGREWRE